MLNLVFFGPPGAGKGTQAAKVAGKFQLVHVSTGDMFRDEIKNKTALGLLAKNYIDKGHLVPDEVLIGMLRGILKTNSNSNGIVFDGFPRTLFQARELDEMLAEAETGIALVISLEVDHDELVRRLVHRTTTESRSDDKKDIVVERLKVYDETTRPLKSYYQQQQKLKPVYGIGEIDEVFKKICDIISQVS